MYKVRHIATGMYYQPFKVKGGYHEQTNLSKDEGHYYLKRIHVDKLLEKPSIHVYVSDKQIKDYNLQTNTRSWDPEQQYLVTFPFDWEIVEFKVEEVGILPPKGKEHEE